MPTIVLVGFVLRISEIFQFKQLGFYNELVPADNDMSEVSYLYVIDTRTICVRDPF